MIVRENNKSGDNPKIILHEAYSPEIHEIISRPPSWLLRAGTGICFMTIVGFFCVTWFIQYPDIVTVPFTLLSENAPRDVISRSDGRLVELLVKDGAEVNSGATLALIESTTNHSEAKKLSEQLETLKKYTISKKWTKVRDFSLSSFEQLGELQNKYQAFYLQLTTLKFHLEGGIIAKQRELILQDTMNIAAMGRILGDQYRMMLKDYELGKEEFLIHDRLYIDKVIPVLEYKREQAKILSKEAPLKQLEVSRIQNESSHTGKQKELLDLDNTVEKQKSIFIQELLTLQSSLDAWKQQFVIIAPIEGKISFLAPLQEQQNIRAGDPILTIEPNTKEFQGIVRVPQTNLGKIQNGQQTLVKLDGYPFREFGLINGVLSNLSATTSKDSAYWAVVKLDRGFRTRHGRTLIAKNGMKGTADIVTADRRLLERILSAINTGR